MKDRYPFLAAWKLQGFKEFPGIPINAIKTEFKKRFFEELREFDETIECSEEEADKITKDWMNRIIKTLPGVLMLERLKLGTFVDKGRKEITKGGDREKFLRHLQDKFFPSTKGGPIVVSTIQKQILKSIHLEVKECIEAIRRDLEDIPLRNTCEYDWSKDRTEDIKESIPEINEIFTDTELSIITRNPSIAKTSYKIIAERLKTAVRFRISPRTLENILSGVPPLSFPQLPPQLRGKMPRL